MYTKLFGHSCFENSFICKDFLLASNGKIYIVGPESYIIRLDPTTDFFTTIDTDLEYVPWSHLVEVNNKLYAIANESDAVLCVDLTDESYTHFTVSSIRAYSKCIAAPNGKIYCIPTDGETSVMCIDTADNTSTVLDTSSLTTNPGWSDGIMVGSKIYCIPSNATSVLCIDIDTDTLSVFGSLSSASIKYIQGVLTDTGKIYAAPYNANNVLCIDTTNDTVTTFGDFSTLIPTTSYKFGHSILAPNNKIYATPYNASCVLCIDTTNDTIEIFGDFSEYGNYKWISIAMTSTNDIYAIPEYVEYILKIDYMTNTTSLIPIENPDAYGWEKTIVLSNDVIYCLPNTLSALKLIPGERPQVNYEYNYTYRINTVYAPSTKWSSAVAIGDKIYGIPSGIPSVLTIDTTKTNELTTIELPRDTEFFDYSSAVVVGNKIYCIPSTANNVLCIDTLDNTTEFIYGSLVDTSNMQWSKGILAPNGKIYGIPYMAESILRIDTNTNSVDTFGGVLYARDWSDGILIGDKIYVMPYHAAHIMCIDTTNDSITTIGDITSILGSDTPSCLKYVLAPNGKIYGIPFQGYNIICFDPVTNEISKFGHFHLDYDKWLNAIVLPNGKIYCVPYSSTTVLCIDTTNNTYTTFGSFDSDMEKWNNSVLGADGKIYALPSKAMNKILRIDPDTNTAETVYIEIESMYDLFSYAILGADNNIYGISDRSLYLFKLSQTELTVPELTNSYKYMRTIGEPILTEVFDEFDIIDVFKIGNELWLCPKPANIYIDTTTDNVGKLTNDSEVSGGVR